MDIVIFHYHLNPGGVTRIIESQIRSLKLVLPDSKIKILCGFCPDLGKFTDLGTSVIVDENLNYLPENLPEDTIKEKYRYIHALFETEVSKQDVLHMHNLNLGKNPVITFTGYQLAKKGYKIVNHAHDFAEDRPANWNFLKLIIENTFGEDLKSVLYPDCDNYQFTTLTLFDLNRLQEYDIKCYRKHLLPNPVNLGPLNGPSNRLSSRKKILEKLNLGQNKKIFTYPVRVIQRKNIGEYILLAVLFAKEAYWLVTQPPKNPKEVVKYNEWKDFCKKNQIEIYFEVGVNMDFDTIISGSDACVTTSIREGFGMVYLEPWLSNTPVIGRELENVISEFKEQGLIFPFLYDALYVNKDGEIADFKDLPLKEQKEFIILAKNQNVKDKIFSLNPNLNNFLNVISDDLISNNKSIIEKYYSLEKFGERLNGIYKRFFE